MADDMQELPLLDDLPVGQQQDRFQHSLYAETLASIFRSVRPGRCVALFGKWGQGKSSVVRLLKEKLSDDITVVTFNAWKSSGDSVRRQLLLHVLRKIAPAEVERIESSCSITIPEEALGTAARRRRRKQGLVGLLKDWRTWAAGLLLPLALLFLCSGLVLTAIGLAWSTPHSSRLLQLAQGSLFPGGIALAVYIASVWRRRYIWHLSIDQPVPEDQRLKYPEQFQKVFATHVGEYCSKRGDLLVVVDDLDRCDARTVAEALAAIRQFTPDELEGSSQVETSDFHCQFLVPCDEMQVVLALEAAGYDAGMHGARRHDYENEELLRKFFDVTVRMQEIPEDDFLEYAASLAESIGLDKQEARELTALARPQDPRLVKQLLNALVLSHDRIRRARECEALPELEDLPNLENTERLLVALRETTPRMYAQIAAEPSLLDRLSPRILTSQEPKSATDDNRAHAMILAAGRISTETAETLIHCKIPRVLHGVQGAGTLIRSVRRFDQELFNESLSGLAEAEVRSVQQWLGRETRRIRESSATGLRQLLSLYLRYTSQGGFGTSHLIPCLTIAVDSDTHLGEALADHPDLPALKVALSGMDHALASRVSRAVLDSFLASEGSSDSELSFLMMACGMLWERDARRLRSWVTQSTEEASTAAQFLERMSASMLGDTSECFGFAPSAAVAASAHLQQWASSANSEAPGVNAIAAFILTLVGHDEEGICECLQQILPLPLFGSQAAVPQEEDSVLSAAWDVVSELFNRASDDCVRRSYVSIEQLHDQGRFSAGEMREPLVALGLKVFRISDDQQSDLAKKMAFRFSKEDPHSTDLIDALGPPPTDEEARSAWSTITTEAGGTYIRTLARLPALAPPGERLLWRMHEQKWPVEVPAEELLVRKLQAADSNISIWLDVLQPLLGRRRKKVREKVLECLTGGHNTGAAMIVGLRVLWDSKVDRLSAQGLAGYFTSSRAQPAQLTNNWNAIREKPGIGSVVEVIEGTLAGREIDLQRDEVPIRIVARELEHLDTSRKSAFIDGIVWQLLHSPDAAIRQKGFRIASKLPQISKKLSSELRDAEYRRRFGGLSGLESQIEEILSRPLI